MQKDAQQLERKPSMAKVSLPTSHSIQLHALQTELKAAETNVAELKRLISELEQQGMEKSCP